MSKSRLHSKEYRWEILDKLLGRGEPLNQQQIFDEYRASGISEKATVGSRERKNPIVFQASFQKDIALFRKTLADNNHPDMLIEDRAPEDTRCRRYYYKEKGFSIMDILTGGMSDSEYLHLVNALQKLKGTVNDETFEEVLFAIRSRVEADYKKGPIYVDYEDNRRLKGREYRPLFYRAMLEKQVLHIHYKTFRGEELEYDFHPYLLKQYNERWFAFGWSKPYGPYTSVPLDRLEMPPVSSGHYSEDRPEKYSEKYFDIRVGVSNNLGATKRHRIELSVHSLDAWGRITTKPFPTQKVVAEYNNEKQVGFISLEIVPNREFFSRLLSLGPEVEVTSPGEIRDYMIRQINAFEDVYK